jgi:hypothetical protein
MVKASGPRAPRRAERLSTALVELAEELDVVQAKRLDHRAERGERQVQRMEEHPDEEPQPERPQNGQLVRDQRQVRRREADGGDA